MRFWFKYFRTWLIIKKKQLLNLFPQSKNNYIRFAIICAPRSGSNWLHTLLNSHHNIISYGEILRKTHVNNPTQKLPTLNELVFYPHHPSIKAVGFIPNLMMIMAHRFRKHSPIRVYRSFT